MKQSKMMIPLLKEAPTDVADLSYQRLIQGGFVRQVVPGVYGYLPLLQRVFGKLQTIIHEELQEFAQELSFPDLVPADLWEKFAPLALEHPAYPLHDQNGQEYLLGASQLGGYLKLLATNQQNAGLSLYTMKTSYRNERKITSGLINSREYFKLEGYTFQADLSQLELSRELLNQSLQQIFRRCGVNVKKVIGENQFQPLKNSDDFVIVSESGTEAICYSTESSYGA
ncbi:MAG: aminoacyl--tRNA ligase-related protein, partial [Enterococcus sp.]